MIGFNRSGYVWHKTIQKDFIKARFRQCLSDWCLLVRDSTNEPTLVAYYVEDIPVGCVDALDAISVENILAEHIIVKRLGVTKLVLELRYTIMSSESVLVPKLTDFIDRMLKTFD